MEGEGTIQTDVSQEAKQERQPSQRELMLSQIEEKVEVERQGQVAPAATDTTQQAGQPVVVDDPQQFLVRVKVDGKEEMKPLAEVVTSYQKNEVASERLRLSSQKLKELEARENALKEKERQILLAGAVSEEGTDPDEKLEEALGALVEGDTATAAQVIRDMVAKGRQSATPVDETAIAARVKEEIAGQNEWENFLRDNPEFREEFDGEGQLIITKERQYGDFVFERDFAPRVEKGEISYLEALNATAAEVRKVFSPPPTATTETSAADKRLERKKVIDNIPVASGARAPGANAAEEESPSDVIKSMRKGRGLPV